MDRVHKSDFGGPGISQKIGLRHVEQGISSFFAKKKITRFDDFSKFRSAFGILYFEKSSNSNIVAKK